MDMDVLQRHAFSVSEFCRCYAIGRTSAYAEIASGRLRTRKVGRRTLILREDAENWAAALPSGSLDALAPSSVRTVS